MPQPAVQLIAGTLRFRGTSVAFVQGGYIVQPATPAPAIVASGGTLVLDPDVRLNPNAGQSVALQVSGAQVIRRQLAAVVVQNLAIGGTLQAALITIANAPSVLLLGSPAAPVSLPFGTLELDLAATVTLAVGSAPANGVITVSVAVPAGLPLGVAVALQGASDLGLGIELSSPSIVLSR